MIKITDIELSKSTLRTNEQFIFRIGMEEVFPTWGHIKKLTVGELKQYTVKQAETLIIKE